ncbi:hypothetical protein [Nocardia spumae]|uniref:hypothetical protein n=1 Tax=Nocardia spumae TaxID=2887190 RepID=UPI001D15B77D|nr:hypothetical protein [Nocardia spumae]
MATTSLPLATAAAVATILSSGTASAAPVDQPNVPTTPAQPGATNEAPAQTDNNNGAPTTPGQDAPGGQQNGPSQPGVTSPNQPGTTSPSQPGVTTPQPGVTTPNQPKPDQNLASPTQPGVTTPRVAPLPVPGQGGQVQPAIVPDQHNPGGQADQLKPGQQAPGQAVTPEKPRTPDSQMDTLRGQGGDNSAPQSQWTSPSLQAAPAAPVVQMTGPHTEVGANVDGGGLAPGYIANTHHFSNLDGYVGTVGYRTPNAVGDAGISVEFVEANKVKITSYTHATGFDDLKSENYVDTTQPNAAKAAVEGWIKQQPGGAAALDAAAQVGRLPQGDFAPQTVNVAGATTQWGGTVQY